MTLSRLALARWLEAYFDAWRSNDPEQVTDLFSEDAVYHYGPFVPPARGREEIVQRWIAGGAPLAEFRPAFEPLLVEGDRGVAHWNVSWRTAPDSGDRTEMDGILLLRFDDEGRCVEHREWYALRSTGETAGTANM